MKHINLLLTVLLATVLSVGGYAQNTCNTAANLTVTSGSTNSFNGITLTNAGTVGDSLWYKLNILADGYLTISSCDATDNPDTRLFFHQGACGSLSLVAASDDNCGLAALVDDKFVSAASNYYLVWDNKSTVSNLTFDFVISHVPTATFENNAPDNDDICDATMLTVDDAPTAGTNVYATVQGTNEHNVGDQLKTDWNMDFNIQNSVWYSFVAPESGAVNVGVETSPFFDAQLAVFSGSCNDFNSLMLEGAVMDNAVTDPSLDLFCLTPGATYWVLVDGFGADRGDFDIQVSSYDLDMPYVVTIDIDTNLNLNGAYCPGEDNFFFTARLLDEDSNAINAPAAYLNSIEIEWSPEGGSGSGTSDVSDDVPAGTYTVTFTDICGRTWSASVTVEDTVLNDLEMVIDELIDPDCIGESAELNFTVDGGYMIDPAFNPAEIGGYIFFFQFDADPNADFADVAMNPLTPIGNSNFFDNQLFQGTWIITVEDACGERDSVQFRVFDPEFSILEVEIDSANSSAPFCPSTATGVVDVRAAGGEGEPLTFTWFFSPDTATTPLQMIAFNGERYTMAAAGVYKIVVSDGCTQSKEVWFKIDDPEIDDLMVVANSTDPSSLGASDGSIDLVATGGQGIHFTQWWYNGLLQPQWANQLSLSGLPQGVYQVTVSDTCPTAGDTTLVIKLLAPLANDEPCDAILIAEGDTAIVYSNEGADTTTGESSLNIPVDQDEGFSGWAADNEIQSSVWFRFVAPNSGAVAIAVEAIGILDFSNLNFDPQVAVFDGACNDFANMELVGANDNEPNFGGVNDSYLELYCLQPGKEYWVLVDGYVGIGQEGCFAIDIWNLSVDPMDMDFNTVDITCLDDKGTINITNVTGGVYMESPETFIYNYDFNGGQTTGTLRVDGSGDITMVDGVPAGMLTFDQLAAGTYTVSISDVCGNSVDKTIVIEDFGFTPFGIDFSVSAPTCPGGSDGSISFTFTGGGTPGNYELDFGATTYFPVNGSITLNGFAAGNYVFTLRDGCDNEKDIFITVGGGVLETMSCTITHDDPTCPAEGDGTVTIESTGGFSQFDYYFGTDRNNLLGNWDEAGSVMDVVDIENLDADKYYILIVNVCTGDTTKFDSVIVADPNPGAVAINVTTNNPSVAGGADGSFTFTITGGFPPYDVQAYRLDDFLNVVEELDIVNDGVTGLTAGFYRVDVNDACGWINGVGAETFELLDPPVADKPCTAEALPTDGSLVFGDNTAATTDAGEDGITPPNQENCTAQTGWCAGDNIDASVWYTVTVPASGSVTIDVESNNFDAQVAVYQVGDCGDFGSFSLLAANDDQSSNNVNASVRLDCLEPGSVLYVMVDANVTADPNNTSGTYTITATANVVNSLQVLGNVTPASDEISNDGTIDVLVMGGVAPFTFQWFDNGNATGITTEDRSGLGAGTYTVIVTDACGNQATKTFSIIQASVSNDDACNATMLPIDGVYRQFSNVGASIQPGEIFIEPDTDGDCFSNTEKKWCANDGLDGTIWFKFKAPQSGEVVVDLCNNGQNTFDTQLAVYKVALCDEFGTYELLAANDDYQSCALGSLVELAGLNPCETYYVMVDADDNERGEMGIRLIDPVARPSAGDDVTVEACTDEGTVDLATQLAGNADMGGEFTDPDNTGALSGSVVNVTALGEGTYTFIYTVGEQCNGEYSTSDQAVITLVVEVCDNVVGFSATNINAYPNPTNGIITIDGLEGAKSISVVDVAGKVVFTTGVSATDVRFDLSDNAKGVYTIRIEAEDGTMIRKRVILQ